MKKSKVLKDAKRVYLVMDQHGMGVRIYFKLKEDAQAYVARLKAEAEASGLNHYCPNYIVLPIVVWGSLAQRDAAPE